MTAATLTGAITEKISDFAELTLPKPSQVAVGVVDAAGRTVETLEQAMHETKRAVDETVPAVVRFVGSLVLPEIVNYQVARVATLATTLGTTVATKGGNAMLNIATFGAPTWLKAARNTLATSNELTQSEWNSSSMFLARCMAENTSAPVIKDNLIRYIGERQELDRALTLHGDASPEVAELRAKITSHEHELTSYRDFERIKEVIDQGLDYVRQNFDQIVVLAERMADKVLKRAENYYQDRLGSFGGIIEGSYKGMGSDAERVEARNELRDRIAVRLKEVFANELGSRDVTKKLQGVRSELLESFGAYREGVSALSYVALGAAYYTGGLSVLVNEALEYAGAAKDAALSYTGEVFTSAWNSTTGWIYDHTLGAFAKGLSGFSNVVATELSHFWDAITPDMPEFIRRRLGW